MKKRIVDLPLLLAALLLAAVCFAGATQNKDELPPQQWEKRIVLVKQPGQNMDGFYLIDHTRKVCFFVLEMKADLGIAEVNCKRLKK